MKRNKTLVCSESGPEKNGGFYDYELDAMEKHAPKLARSTKILVEHLPEFKSDFADMVLIFQRSCNTFKEGKMSISSIVEGCKIAIKGAKVFLVAQYPSLESESCANLYHVWRIHYNAVYYQYCMPAVYYEFKRCGGDMLKVAKHELENHNCFESVDWHKLQTFTTCR